MKPGDLQARKAFCVYCTDKAIAFLGSPYTLLPFDINIPLVQARYHCDRQPRIFPNFHCRPYTAVHETRSFPARKAQCVYYTGKAITFLGSPYPWLPFDVNIPLVQTRYHCDRQPRSFPNFHCRLCTAVHETGDLPAAKPCAFIAPTKRLHF